MLYPSDFRFGSTPTTTTATNVTTDDEEEEEEKEKGRKRKKTLSGKTRHHTKRLKTTEEDPTVATWEHKSMTEAAAHLSLTQFTFLILNKFRIYDWTAPSIQAFKQRSLRYFMTRSFVRIEVSCEKSELTTISGASDLYIRDSIGDICLLTSLFFVPFRPVFSPRNKEELYWQLTPFLTQKLFKELEKRISMSFTPDTIPESLRLLSCHNRYSVVVHKGCVYWAKPAFDKKVASFHPFHLTEDLLQFVWSSKKPPPPSSRPMVHEGPLLEIILHLARRGYCESEIWWILCQSQPLSYWQHQKEWWYDAPTHPLLSVLLPQIKLDKIAKLFAPSQKTYELTDELRQLHRTVALHTIQPEFLPPSHDPVVVERVRQRVSQFDPCSTQDEIHVLDDWCRLVRDPLMIHVAYIYQPPLGPLLQATQTEWTTQPFVRTVGGKQPGQKFALSVMEKKETRLWLSWMQKKNVSSIIPMIRREESTAAAAPLSYQSTLLNAWVHLHTSHSDSAAAELANVAKQAAQTLLNAISPAKEEEEEEEEPIKRVTCYDYFHYIFHQEGVMTVQTFMDAQRYLFEDQHHHHDGDHKETISQTLSNILLQFKDDEQAKHALIEFATRQFPGITLSTGSMFYIARPQVDPIQIWIYDILLTFFKSIPDLPYRETCTLIRVDPPSSSSSSTTTPRDVLNHLLDTL
jgi:hypothetical protein